MLAAMTNCRRQSDLHKGQTRDPLRARAARARAPKKGGGPCEGGGPLAVATSSSAVCYTFWLRWLEGPPVRILGKSGPSPSAEGAAARDGALRWR